MDTPSSRLQSISCVDDTMVHDLPSRIVASPLRSTPSSGKVRSIDLPPWDRVSQYLLDVKTSCLDDNVAVQVSTWGFARGTQHSRICRSGAACSQV